MSNEKEVTIYDIAKKLNISAATVSRGLQDHPGISKKTKKKIFDTVELSESYYHQLPWLRNGRSGHPASDQFIERQRTQPSHQHHYFSL